MASILGALSNDTAVGTEFLTFIGALVISVAAVAEDDDSEEVGSELSCCEDGVDAESGDC